MRDRLAEFVKYHIEGDADCNGRVLKAWADEHELSFEQRFDLAYFFDICYCVSSGVFMYTERDKIAQNPQEWGTTHKEIILFQSDRKYTKMRRNFEGCLEFYAEQRSDRLERVSKCISGRTLDIEKALEEVQSWYFHGRFASYLFLETFIALNELNHENAKYDWKHGDTATSGVMNIYGLDAQADYFDKYQKLPPNVEPRDLDGMLDKIVHEVARNGGDTAVTSLETSLCAYRKFFKGSRYNGFYLDRQLEEIHETNNYSETTYSEINSELLKIRDELFSKKYLGEHNNWTGIRKPAKKLYKQKRIMM